jgi:putative oxidoreductase
MKYLIIIARVLLGLVFVVFGANAFFHFIPQQPMPEKGAAFIMPLITSGYYYPIAVLQVLGGLCLLLGARFVPLGLTLLGPIIVNIMLFHIFLVRDGLGIAVVISVLALFLLWVYRFKFPALFRIGEPL